MRRWQSVVESETGEGADCFTGQLKFMEPGNMMVSWVYTSVPDGEM